MWILIDISEMDDYVRPLLALDPMNRRQHDPVRIALHRQVLTKPRFE